MPKKRDSFSNATMRAPVEGKPHIQLIDDWWRVSKFISGGGNVSFICARLDQNGKAHDFARKLNDKRHAKNKRPWAGIHE